MLKEIRLEELAPSPTNPRKTFDQVKLEELAASIREKGILEPLLVRPHVNGDGTKYEVVAGERRFRGARLAERETAPCIVQDLTDLEVLEVQTIENLQRDDVHPLEEAEGYVALMKAGEYDEGRIAERIGKTRAYVYRRVQLVNLIPALKRIFTDGELGVGHAELLSVLKPEEQARVLGTNHRGELTPDTAHSGLFRSVGGHLQTRLGIEGQRNRKAVSLRELQTYIDDHIRFDPAAVDLPNLFPDTHVALGGAEEEALKVIHITRDHQLKPETRLQGQRTYSVRSWKRADGKVEPSVPGGGVLDVLAVQREWKRHDRLPYHARSVTFTVIEVKRHEIKTDAVVQLLRYMGAFRELDEWRWSHPARIEGIVAGAGIERHAALMVNALDEVAYVYAEDGRPLRKLKRVPIGPFSWIEAEQFASAVGQDVETASRLDSARFWVEYYGRCGFHFSVVRWAFVMQPSGDRWPDWTDHLELRQVMSEQMWVVLYLKTHHVACTTMPVLPPARTGPTYA